MHISIDSSKKRPVEGCPFDHRPAKMNRVETETQEAERNISINNNDNEPVYEETNQDTSNRKALGSCLSSNDVNQQNDEHDQESVSTMSNDEDISTLKPNNYEHVGDLFRSLDPTKCAPDMDPDSYFHKLMEAVMNFKPKVRPTLEISSLYCDDSNHPFIPPISEEEQASYCVDVVSAVRENDLKTIESFHSSGRSLSCCNRFGESLLHMACRRGFESMVLYLVERADVSVRITDDCGRTPLHDGLWNKDCKYAIMDLLVRTDPILLLTCDKRGHTPFAYARREHWANWRQFLWDRREHMKSAFIAEEVELFRSS